MFTPKGELLTLPNNSTVLDVAFELHSEIGMHCIAGKVNHKLVPLSHRLHSGDQVEVLTSQSQTPKPDWVNYLATAKAKSRLRQLMRREMAPVIEQGREIYEKYLADNSITDNNSVITKVLGTLRYDNREALFTALGRGEATLPDYLAKSLRPASSSIFSKILRPLKGKKSQNTDIKTPTKRKVNMKETYVLEYDEKNGHNFKLCDCCSPVPGDDVMGWVNDDGEVELHALSCPRASVLKASYGKRILNTRWAEQSGLFLAEVRIEGIDRFGILQEIIQMISMHLAIDIRKLDIEAEKEVFHCDLAVRVHDTKVITDLCSKLRNIRGVQRAARVNHLE